MKKYFTTLSLLVPLFVLSQNLVSNGGFEQYSSLPDFYCEWDRCIGWTNVNGSTGCGAFGTPDYYSTNGTSPVKLPKIANGDSINPHGGNAIMGFITIQVPPNIAGYREYIMTKLNTPMVQGTTYQVAFYLSNAYFPTYGYGSNNIGFCFSNAAFHQATYEVIKAVPQIEIDTIVYANDWTYFQFNYTADSAYQYLTIGNFKTDSMTLRQNFNHTGNIAYYFIDDISVTSVAVTPPVAGFTTADSAICQNGCVNYQNLSSNATSWQWTFAGGSPATSSAENPQICYIDSGCYDVSLIATNSNGSDTITATNYINVFAAPPTPVITMSNDTLYCATDTSYSSYQWYSDTTLLAGDTTPVLVISGSGNYNIKVTSKNGCSTAVGIVLGIKQFADVKEFTISPNPATSELRINEGELRIETIEIYNVLGQVCSQSSIINHQSSIVIDVSSLPSGVYFVQLINENQRWVRRFVKE